MVSEKMAAGTPCAQPFLELLQAKRVVRRKKGRREGEGEWERERERARG
jgi:hypothetical protein